MKTVGIRALKQNASEVVAEVARGETVEITSRGRAVAQLIPVAQDRLASLVAAGRARPARRTPASLGPALSRRRGTDSLTQVLTAQRADERY